MKLKYIIILSFLIVSSCGKKKETSQKPSIVKEVESLPSIVEKTKENVAITKILKQLSPITATDMDAWMPSKLGVMERTTYLVDVLPQMGVFTTKAVFKDPNSKRSLKITFMDGAGEQGSRAISPYLNLERLYEDRTDANGFQKIITKNEMKIVQKYKKRGDIFDLEFAPKNRFIIKIETEFLTEEELWTAINLFPYDKLPGI